MPKILQLKTVDRPNIQFLTLNLTYTNQQRQLKLKVPQRTQLKQCKKTLDKNNQLLIILKVPLLPDTTYSRLPWTGLKMGPWGRSVELEGDFGDFHSNCNVLLLLSCPRIACKFADLSDSFDYIKTFVSFTMQRSYFLDPTWTYRTLQRISMGACSAARGSEIILRVHEFEIWRQLFSKKLRTNLYRFLRFRDDVSVHISGANDNIAYTLKIIIEGFPKAIQFNVKTKIYWGKLLNIRIFNDSLPLF